MHDEHDHRHDHGSHLSETELRVRALETILVERDMSIPKRSMFDRNLRDDGRSA